MTLFRRIEDGAYPVSEQFIRDTHPNTSFPSNIPIETILDFGFEPVFETPQPEVKQWQMVVEKPPVKSKKGNWEMVWEVVDMPFNEITDQDGKVIKTSKQVNAEYLERLKLELIASVTNLRYSIETGGIMLEDGTKLSTSREHQSLMQNLYFSLKSKLIESSQLKLGNNTWVNVTLDTFEPIAKAVANHVSNCFITEKNHIDAISKITSFKQFESYDINANWPGKE